MSQNEGAHANQRQILGLETFHRKFLAVTVPLYRRYGFVTSVTQPLGGSYVRYNDRYMILHHTQLFTVSSSDSDSST